MKLLDKYSTTFFFVLFVLLTAATVNAQDARLRLDRLNGLEARARDVVEVNVDGKLLDLAKRVTGKVDDANAKKVAESIAGLKGIYVRVFNFENENEYNLADIDDIRSQLNGPGWERLANARSKRNNQKVDVYTMFTGDLVSGVAVVVSESKRIAIVNMIGPIDIEALTELSGRFNIPKIEVERTTEEKPLPKE
jgi:hypothetical protein